MKVRSEQKLLYVTKEGQDGIFTIPQETYQALAAEELKIYKVHDPDEVLRVGLYRTNPHFFYILGSNPKLFGAYLNSHHPDLKNIFLVSLTEDPPFFSLQDNIVKDIIIRKFNGNPLYRIFDVEDGRIKARRYISNREAEKIVKCILLDCIRVYELSDDSMLRVFKDEAKSLMQKVSKFSDAIEKIRKEYVKKANDIDVANLPQWQKEIDRLKKKLDNAVPLWSWTIS